MCKQPRLSRESMGQPSATESLHFSGGTQLRGDTHSFMSAGISDGLENMASSG